MAFAATSRILAANRGGDGGWRSIPVNSVSALGEPPIDDPGLDRPTYQLILATYTRLPPHPAASSTWTVPPPRSGCCADKAELADPF